MNRIVSALLFLLVGSCVGDTDERHVAPDGGMYPVYTPDAATDFSGNEAEAESEAEAEAEAESESEAESEGDCSCLDLPCATSRCENGVCLYEYPDADFDGFISGEGDCPGTDCDDANADIHPGAGEICDSLDNDCDPATIDGSANLYGACYPDGVSGCDATRDVPLCVGECHLGLAACVDGVLSCTNAVVPADETCDGTDNNCDGVIDEGVTIAGCVDADGDGHGNPAARVATCGPEPGVVSVCDDCDDAAPTTHPGADDFCEGNGVDDDCDGEVDEYFPTLCVDADGDGLGNPDAIVHACIGVSGTAPNCDDCNDDDPLLGEACEFADSICDESECERSFAAGSFGLDDAGDERYCFCDELCLSLDDCCENFCGVCGVDCGGVSEPSADGGTDLGRVSPVTPDGGTEGEADAGGAGADGETDAGADGGTDLGNDLGTPALPADLGVDAGVTSADAGNPALADLGADTLTPLSIPPHSATVQWETPGCETADRITVSGVITSAGGVSDGWRDLCRATNATLVECAVPLLEGQSFDFSIEYREGAFTSWSCTGSGAASTVNGRLATSLIATRDRSCVTGLQPVAVPNGVGGCNLRITAPTPPPPPAGGGGSACTSLTSCQASTP